MVKFSKSSYFRKVQLNRALKLQMIHIRTISLKDCISTVIFNKYVVYGSFWSQKCAKIVKIEENMGKLSKFSYSKKYTTIYSSQISPNGAVGQDKCP